MRFPLGDILRAVLPWNWLKKLKGIEIKKGGTTIVLNEGHGPTRPNTPFDKPNRPGR